MSFKATEFWSYGGFNIITEAEFEKNGIRLMEGWKASWTDVVRIRTTIYNPYTAKIDTFIDGDAHECEVGTKGKWYHKWTYETVPISTAYEEKMIKAYNKNIDYIKELIVNKQVTDGLPDSLKGL